MLSTLIRRNKPRSEMSFMEHLDDLRISLIRVVTVFAIGMVTALVFKMPTNIRSWLETAARVIRLVVPVLEKPYSEQPAKVPWDILAGPTIPTGMRITGGA